MDNLEMLVFLSQMPKPGAAETLALSDTSPFTFDYFDNNSKSWECCALDTDRMQVTVSDRQIHVVDGPEEAWFPAPNLEDNDDNED